MNGDEPTCAAVTVSRGDKARELARSGLCCRSRCVIAPRCSFYAKPRMLYCTFCLTHLSLPKRSLVTDRLALGEGRPQTSVNPLAMARDFDEPRGRPSLWNVAEVTKLTFITAIEPSGVGG